MALRYSSGITITLSIPEEPPAVPAIELRSQQVSVWCWAACIDMVLRARGGMLQQCTIVGEHLGQECCPAGDPPAPCQRPLEPDQVAPLWEKLLGHPVSFHCGALSVGDLILAINPAEKRPVEVWLGEMHSCDPLQGSGHVLLAIDHFKGEKGQDWFVLCDPNPNNEQSQASYDGLVSGMSYGRWVGAWTGI